MRPRARALFIALAVTIPAVAWGHTGDRVFPIYELPTADLPDLHDGSLEDWEQVLPAASLDHNDLRTSTGQSNQPFDPLDLAVRVFLAWNHTAQRIYFAAEFIDDVAYASESLQIMLDGDHSGDDYDFYPQDEESLASRTGAQFHEIDLHPRQGGDPLFRGSPQSGWSYQPPWTDFGRAQFGEQPAQTIVEMSFTPWDRVGEGSENSVRSQLVAGRVLGFQLAFPDFDPELEAVYVLGNASVGLGGYRENARQFADGELIPCDELDCSHARTAVEVSSWTRIKAGM